MSAEIHFDAGTLAEYWLGTLPKLEEERIEEHLFACDECGARLDEVIALAEGVSQIARGGALMSVVSQGFLKQATAEGLRIRQYSPSAGGSVACTVTAEDDLLVGRLEANLLGMKQVDLSLCAPTGEEQFRLRDIPFDPGADCILWQQSITFAKAAPTSTMVARLIQVAEAGEEKLLGEYTFNHTRTLPGPGTW
jgi:hypothetical protein